MAFPHHQTVGVPETELLSLVEMPSPTSISSKLSQTSLINKCLKTDQAIQDTLFRILTNTHKKSSSGRSVTTCWTSSNSSSRCIFLSYQVGFIGILLPHYSCNMQVILSITCLIFSRMIPLCHINNLPLSVKSQVRLFADDCRLYREIRNHEDHIALHSDLKSLENWAAEWGMRFNAGKCYILSIKSKTSHFYKLNNTILKHVDSNTYLGVLISKDLTWSNHITNICNKASSTLGFLRRNLKHCPLDCRKKKQLLLPLYAQN